MLCKPHSNQNQKPTVNTQKVKINLSIPPQEKDHQITKKENKKRQQKRITTDRKN